MFTIKAMTPYGERLHTATEIDSGPNGVMFKEAGGDWELIPGIHRRNGECYSIDTMVYVMNDAGKTVSQYRLAPTEEVPPDAKAA